MNFKQEPAEILSGDVIDLAEELSQIDYGIVEKKCKTENILDELEPEEIDIKEEPVGNVIVEACRASPSASFDKLVIFECAQCGYTTTSKPSLKSHVKIHLKVKPFACTLCDYKTVDKSNLRSHLRGHTGEKPYKCPHCDYKSNATSAVKEHMTVHTGEKNYKCKFCSFSTRYKVSFTIHVRKHTGEKPFKCSHCDYRSSNKSTINAHIKIHTGEKPHQCPHCEYKARVRFLLKKHMKRIHSHNVNKANSSNTMKAVKTTQYYRYGLSSTDETTMLRNVNVQNNPVQMYNTDGMFNTNVYDTFGFSLFNI